MVAQGNLTKRGHYKLEPESCVAASLGTSLTPHHTFALACTWQVHHAFVWDEQRKEYMGETLYVKGIRLGLDSSRVN